MQGSRLDFLVPDKRKNLIKNRIYDVIEKDLKDKNISKNEIEDIVEEKTISELERLGFNENGYKLHDNNTSTLSRGSSISAILDTSINESYQPNELRKIETVLKKYLATTNPPDDYANILPELSQAQRIYKVKQFYLDQAKHVQYYEFLPKKDFDEIIKNATNATLLLFGFTPAGKYIDEEKRKQEARKKSKKPIY